MGYVVSRYALSGSVNGIYTVRQCSLHRTYNIDGEEEPEVLQLRRHVAVAEHAPEVLHSAWPRKRSSEGSLSTRPTRANEGRRAETRRVNLRRPAAASTRSEDLVKATLNPALSEVCCFLYVCMHAYIHAYIHTCMRACIHTYITYHECMHACLLGLWCLSSGTATQRNHIAPFMHVYPWGGARMP